MHIHTSNGRALSSFALPTRLDGHLISAEEVFLKRVQPLFNDVYLSMQSLIRYLMHRIRLHLLPRPSRRPRPLHQKSWSR
jgi:hypothetical protein